MFETPMPFLPARDPDLRGRRLAIGLGRTQYRFTSGRVAGIPMSESVPEHEDFGNAYWGMRNDLDSLVRNQNLLAAKVFRSRPLRLEEHAKLYPGPEFTPPASIGSWESDAYFAEQRLSGPNPLSISRVPASGTDTHCLIQDKHVVASLPAGESLFSLADSGRLFQLDFVSLLDGIDLAGTASSKGIRSPRPIALFYLPTPISSLMPLAIQIGTSPGQIFTPTGNAAHWSLAKLCVQTADANFHQLFWHLGRTHLVLERFAVVAGRTLAPNHPVRILLDAHLRFVLAINREATQNLIQPGGPVDVLFAGSLEDSIKVAHLGATTWDATEARLPNQLASRGAEDLSNYAFAEDAIMIWDAISRYVRRYLEIYYQQSGDNPPSRDPELSAFVASLVRDGQLKGISPLSAILVDELEALLTTVIFTSSALHAAVNYPQFDYESYCPNMPLSEYDDRDRFFRSVAPSRGDLEEFLTTYLAPSRAAVLQIELTYTLSHFKYDRLGEYEFRLAHVRAREAQVDFQRDLVRIETEITGQNRSRPFPYLTLLPSNIPNSTSL